MEMSNNLSKFLSVYFCGLIIAFFLLFVNRGSQKRVFKNPKNTSVPITVFYKRKKAKIN